MIILGSFLRVVRILEPLDAMLPSDTPLKFHSVAEVRDFLRWSVKDEFQSRSVREALIRLEGHVHTLTDEEVLDRLALHVLSGELEIVVRNKTLQRAKTLAGVSGFPQRVRPVIEKRRPPVRVEPPPPRPTVTKQLSWVEIVLVDTSGKPVPGVRYRLELPDGQFQEGNLDENGRARADEIEPGTCWISFPDHDKEAITRG